MGIFWNFSFFLFEFLPIFELRIYRIGEKMVNDLLKEKKQMI